MEGDEVATRFETLRRAFGIALGDCARAWRQKAMRLKFDASAQSSTAPASNGPRARGSSRIV
jgi:hypothetical protein